MQQIADALRREHDWIISRRWFGDKARPVIDIEVLVADTVQVANRNLLLIVVQFDHEWGDPTTYFLPLLADGETLADRDAINDTAILRWFVDGFADHRVITGSGTWRWRQIGDALPDTHDLSDDAIHLITAEQSNSSIVFGHHAIGKVFRRLQPGVNPDLEIGEHLMHVGTFHHVPQLYGVLELEIDGEQIDIVALQQFVPNIGDGWNWLLHQLGDEARFPAAMEAVRLLGQRTGEMHLALATEAGDVAFQPELIGEDEAEAIIRRIITEMEASVEGLTHHMSPAELERLHKGLGAMMGDAWSMLGTILMRVHGDYHLGQTLRTTDGDFAIIDFEGEPSRTMDERRQKLPALKDVAGMLRSLDYAGATLMQQTDDGERRAALATWVAEASDVFVEAYRSAISLSNLPLVPQSDEAFSSVLDLMIAEKALYELRYEMNNRPHWLWIPLDALGRLVDMELST